MIFVDPRQYFLLGAGFGDHARQSLPSLLQSAKAIGVIVGLFFLVAAAFAVLATRIGELLDGFRERPLRGYSLNIAGSLAGVLMFSLLAFEESPPFVWLLVSLPPLVLFYRPAGRRAAAAICFAIAIAAAGYADSTAGVFWSPYYRVGLWSPPDGRRVVSVNHDAFQAIEDLSSKHLATLPAAAHRAQTRHYTRSRRSRPCVSTTSSSPAKA
ncbi:MAG: hypothetical protein DMD79_13365 [Candidatus Rokuibacteriota bacterium]|nr:MAG: hypothetical protein DMD79_13365 [Candidatus Rokubacteria bacterium]